MQFLPSHPSPYAGFTLIEVMVVVVVVTILSAIAYPSYQDSIRKSRRTDAKVALTQASHALERFYTEQSPNTYVGATAGSTFAANSPENYYAISFSVAATATTFTLQAVPQGAQVGDPCGNLTLNQAGVKGVASATYSASQCW